MLRTSSSSTINIGDYEFVAAANLMTDFADGEVNTSYSLDASGQAALTTYLQSNWVENDYVFLRIRSGVIGPAPADASYFFGGNSSQSDAQLTLTAVPPPPPTDMQVQTTTDLAGTALQAGWDLVDGDRNAATIIGVVDGVTITVTGVGRSAGGDGGSYAVVDHTDGDLDNLLSGGRLNGANPDLTLAGLADGIYSITTYHHACYDHPNGSYTFDFDVTLTDANGTDVLVHDDLRTSQGDTVSTADLGMAVTTFTVSGGNDVELSFTPGADFSSGLNQLVLNGFEFSRLPSGTVISIQ